MTAIHPAEAERALPHEDQETIDRMRAVRDIARGVFALEALGDSHADVISRELSTFHPLDELTDYDEGWGLQVRMPLGYDPKVKLWRPATGQDWVQSEKPLQHYLALVVGEEGYFHPMRIAYDWQDGLIWAYGYTGKQTYPPHQGVAIELSDQAVVTFVKEQK